MDAASSSRIDGWLDAVITRHTSAFTTPEFLKAVRALSARYVETRHALPGRSPIDTAGKRAAFAGFYAPLHFITMRAVLAAVAADLTPPATIVDLGCGTGVVGAAWALTGSTPVSLIGIDQNPWVLGEAKWNWQALGLRGRTLRGDLERPLHASVPKGSAESLAGFGLTLGWAVNELPASRWPTLLDELRGYLDAGASVLIVEPLARSASPWWDTWSRAWLAAGGRADEWKFEANLPPTLAALDEAAGFRRDTLGARTLWAAGTR